MAQSFEFKIGNHNGHDRFLELCALYGSGSLTGNELAQLNDHLPDCPECTELLQEYARIVRHSIPVLAEPSQIAEVTKFDAELLQGRAQLLAKVEQSAHDKAAPRIDTVTQHERLDSPFRAISAMAYALALVIAICAGIGGFVVGARNAHQSSRTAIESKQRARALELPSVTPDKIGVVTGPEIKRLSDEINRLRNELSATKKSAENSYQDRSQQADTISRLSNENAGVKADRDQIARNLGDAQAQVTQLNRDMDRLRSERDDALLRNSEFDKKVEAFKEQLRTLSDTISEQQRLLAADRDIRELMGARDLLLADVFDIDQNGRNKTPFGRIFYTKDKSLIFYAFDLDRQPGLRNAGAFQVWGARAADNGKGSAFNMGIFYMDNEAMRRWVLKFDNPKILAQIDSVFVTVEPQGGSDRPRGKQLLFASLRGEPNHP
jgi:hypothetical protein